MNLLCVSSRDKYEGELMGYNAVGSKLVYLTDREISVVKLGGKFGKESTAVKGEQVINFVVSKRGFVALLYRNRTVEVRRMDRLSEVSHRFNNVLLLVEEGYPKMKWDYD
jgi:serine/threonine-protein kinase RIO1